jgi:hypothetical protein
VGCRRRRDRVSKIIINKEINKTIGPESPGVGGNERSEAFRRERTAVYVGEQIIVVWCWKSSRVGSFE